MNTNLKPKHKNSIGDNGISIVANISRKYIVFLSAFINNSF